MAKRLSLIQSHVKDHFLPGKDASDNKEVVQVDVEEKEKKEK